MPLFFLLLFLLFFPKIHSESISGGGQEILPTPSQKSNKVMAICSHPLATKEALHLLCQGASAVDAAIAAQMVLNVVQPQSSGIGGGAYLLYYDKLENRTVAYDGREVASLKVDPDFFINPYGEAKSKQSLAQGAAAVAVPGLLKMLALAHNDYGKVKWQRLFYPAIEYAKKGFFVSKELEVSIKNTPSLKKFANARAVFFKKTKKGYKPKKTGDLILQPLLADTLEKISRQGADLLYRGSLASEIINTLRFSPYTPAEMSLEDFQNYEAKKQDPLIFDYRNFQIICPSFSTSGGITLLSALGILENVDFSLLPAYSLESLHMISEASKLAYADRDLFLADTHYVSVPVKALLNKNYLQKRFLLIDPKKALDKAEGGNIALWNHNYTRHTSLSDGGTAHMCIVDLEGNAVSMTSSINTAFGSHLMTGGFLLNNHLLDFSFLQEKKGKKIANAMAPGKRPRSSMSPLFVFDKKTGALRLIAGSSGGSRIIAYLLKTLVHTLDYGMDVETVLKKPNFVCYPHTLELEKGSELSSLTKHLKKMGHRIDIRKLRSGVLALWITEDQEFQGAIDPRREGQALGEGACLYSP